MNSDKVEGFAKKVEGSVESAYGNVTGNSSHQAKGNAKKALGVVQDAFGTAEDYVRDSFESVNTQINDKPLQSTIIALGVGFVIGRLFRL